MHPFPPRLLLTMATASLALLAGALYLQFVENMAPCPLCIMQRYGFVGVALFCIAAAVVPPTWKKPAAGLGLVSALSGGGVAIWHLWVKAHPAVSCGIDPLETSLNKIITARLLPFLFRADGFCTTEYDPILGLSLPQWALVAFVGFSLVLGWLCLRRTR